MNLTVKQTEKFAQIDPHILKKEHSRIPKEI